MPTPLYDIVYLERLRVLLSGLKKRSIELLAPQPGDIIADIGCGTGKDAITIASAGAKVYGIDHNPAMIEVALNQLLTDLNIEFICNDADKLDLPDNSIDKIRFDRVFQHLDNYDKALQEAYRVLKPGGQLQIIDPDHFSITFFLKDIVLERKLVDMVAYHRIPNSYKIRHLPDLLNSVGFNVNLREVHNYLIDSFELANYLIRFDEVVETGYAANDFTYNQYQAWQELKKLPRGQFNLSVNLLLINAIK